jgi:hypothetical protein
MAAMRARRAGGVWTRADLPTASRVQLRANLAIFCRGQNVQKVLWKTQSFALAAVAEGPNELIGTCQTQHRILGFTVQAHLDDKMVVGFAT